MPPCINGYVGSGGQPNGIERANRSVNETARTCGLVTRRELRVRDHSRNSQTIEWKPGVVRRDAVPGAASNGKRKADPFVMEDRRHWPQAEVLPTKCFWQARNRDRTTTVVCRSRNVVIILGSKSMFELERAIKNWRQSFDNDQAIDDEASLELESHLRELVGDLSNIGLSPREAFIVAADRLGHPSDLQREYAKVNSSNQWRQRISWMITGYLAMSVAGSIISFVTTLTGTTMAFAGVSGKTTGSAMVIVTAAMWIGLLTLARRHLATRNQQIPTKWIIAMGALLVFTPVLRQAARMFQVRLVNSTWHAETIVIAATGGFVIHFCVLAVCFATIWKLNKPVAKNVL